MDQVVVASQVVKLTATCPEGPIALVKEAGGVNNYIGNAFRDGSVPKFQSNFNRWAVVRPAAIG